MVSPALGPLLPPILSSAQRTPKLTRASLPSRGRGQAKHFRQSSLEKVETAFAFLPRARAESSQSHRAGRAQTARQSMGSGRDFLVTLHSSQFSFQQSTRKTGEGQEREGSKQGPERRWSSTVGFASVFQSGRRPFAPWLSRFQQQLSTSRRSRNRQETFVQSFQRQQRLRQLVSQFRNIVVMFFWHPTKSVG